MPVKKLLTELPAKSLSQYISSAGSLKINDTLQRLSQHFGDNMPVLVNESELQIPDTKIAQASTELSLELNKPTIFKHSVRTFMFGICIGKHLNELKDIDREQFYISCILHKIGLSDTIRDLPGNKGRDFELIGADHAHSFLRAEEQNYDKLKADQVHEAIALSTSSDVVTMMDPQFKLLHQGSVLDVIGAYKYNVRQEDIDAICKKYPRDNFANEFGKLYERELQDKPHSAVGFDISGGLLPLISMNPLDQTHGYPL